MKFNSSIPIGQLKDGKSEANDIHKASKEIAIDIKGILIFEKISIL